MPETRPDNARGERASVERSGSLPATAATLRSDLERLGLAPGSCVLVHCSLSSLGWIVGGAESVVRALLDCIGPEGTLMAPTHTAHLSEPSNWRRPPVPESWWQIIRDELPPFDPSYTEPRAMGRVAERIWRMPGARRSAHPQVSFAAFGPHSGALTAGHAIDFGLGESSPLARLYDLRGQVLLLGVGFERCTALHLAEHRFGGQPRERNAAPVLEGGKRIWRELDDIESDDGDFPAIGAALEEERPQTIRRGKVAAGEAILAAGRDLVDFAAEWMRRNRAGSPAG